MNLKNKNVLVVGLGITGVSIVKTLEKLDSNIMIYDNKDREKLEEILASISHIEYTGYFGKDSKSLDLASVDLIVKSPGVPPNIDILEKARGKNVKIITDFELAYHISNYKDFIVVTGTNGKTTTVTLLGEVFKDMDYKTHTLGNIGNSLLDGIEDEEKEDIYILEASSFQLNDIYEFRPSISLILNITPDHLDWHGTYEEYKKAKLNLLKNQGKNDYAVLNYDDKELRELKGSLSSKEIWFSSKEVLDKGIYIKDKSIYIDGKRYMDLDEIKLLGAHNLENILGVIGVVVARGEDLESVRETIRNFKGVEHRLEYVKTIEGIDFYNDSKGTNIEASIKAIEAVKENIILLAGGYNKGADYTPLIESFNGRVKDLILFGETKDMIRSTALKLGFENVHIVNDMKEAVDLAYNLSKEGDKVLLSPACASWGMYENFELRGKDFKRLVNLL